jgi:hypothetical protein
MSDPPVGGLGPPEGLDPPYAPGHPFGGLGTLLVIVVAVLAQALQVIRIPEQLGITTVTPDMVRNELRGIGLTVTAHLAGEQIAL